MVLVRLCQMDTRQIPHGPFPSLHYPQRLKDQRHFHLLKLYNTDKVRNFFKSHKMCGIF